MNARTPTFILVTILAVGHGLYACRTGPITSPDTLLHSSRADLLIAARFDYASYLAAAARITVTSDGGKTRQLTAFVHPGFNVAWITLVALFKCAFGTAWKEALVALNWVMSVMISTLVLVVVQRVTKSAAAVLFVAVCLALAYELFSWIPYVLNDVSFVALMLALLVVTINIRRSAGVALVISYVACAGLALIILFYRPTATPAVLTVCVALIFGRISRAHDPAARPVFARRFAAAAATLLILVVVAHAAVMQNPARWPMGIFRSWITNQLSVEARFGWVIHDRPMTYRAAPKSLSDHLLLTASRSWHFLMVAPPEFSTAHKLWNSLFFLPLYVFALVAVTHVLGRHSRLGADGWWTAWVFSVLVMSFLAFHSLQKIDFDWRYRLPVLPPLCILAGIGFAECWPRVISLFPYQRRGNAAPEPERRL